MTTDTDTPATPAALALVLQTRDNVATALFSLDAGTLVHASSAGSTAAPVVLRETIALCHKFALQPIAQGEQVFKYGEVIGLARCNIATGEHVHTHNLVSARAR